MVDLNERLMADLKEAMRARDEVRVSAIRMTRAAITNASIEKGRPLTDDEVMGVLSRQIKQRRESIEQFTRGNRLDLVAREQKELDVLLSYMPQQMSRDEIAEAARACIREVGAKGPGDFGKVMSKLASQLKGRADGRVVSEVLHNVLSQPHE